jgi:hypothetical protein
MDKVSIKASAEPSSKRADGCNKRVTKFIDVGEM